MARATSQTTLCGYGHKAAETHLGSSRALPRQRRVRASQLYQMPSHNDEVRLSPSPSSTTAPGLLAIGVIATLSGILGL